MKKIAYIVISLAALFLQSCQHSEKLELNVMTFNIRYDNPEDSLNNWKYRKDVVCQTVENYDVDILGTQEVLANQLEDMKLRLPAYNAIGVGREDGIDQGEYSALFYKKDKFKALDSGTFWLSETPDMAGSKGWDGACERIATWAVLEEIATGKKIFAINTHLDHVGREARVKGAALMLEKASELGKELPIILTGDFNSGINSDVVKFITNEKMDNSLINTREHAVNKKERAWTFHDFGNLPNERCPYIDYIFASRGTHVLEYEVVDEKLNDIYLSDHMPVFAKIEIE